MLPTERNTPGRDPLNKKYLIYADYKTGKSTLASKLFPDAIFLAADPTGLEELPVFKVPADRGIKDWAEFRTIGQEIAELKTKQYEAIVVDGTGELVRLCSEHVLKDLPGGPAKGYLHASDWDFGKAWGAITDEFRLRVGKLCSLGLPVVFIAHSKKSEKKNRVGVDITVQRPDIPGGSGTWLQGFVDYIFYAEIVQTEQGESRVLRTAPAETYLAGARQPEGVAQLPGTLPLDGARLRSALLATAVPLDMTHATIASREGFDAVVEGQASPLKPVRQKTKA